MPKIVAVNKKAFADYEILEKYEAGIVLNGKEVRSIRDGRVNLKGSFARVMGDELWLINCYIASEEPDRTRKLLVHKKELTRLIGKMQEQGLTLLPLRLYFKNNRIKLELGLARGLKIYDKREKIKKREIQRKMSNYSN